MKIFTCPACGQTVFFENPRCLRCGHQLAFLPELGIVSALEPKGGEAVDETTVYRAIVPDGSRPEYRLCAHQVRYQVCNWGVPADAEASFCLGCRFNETIPDLSDGAAFTAWGKMENAKKRLLYSFLTLGLPLEPRDAAHPGGLAFAFLQPVPGGEPVVTGHRDGLITINLDEANDVHRMKMERDMGEAYRTVLGHFRHESGHYWWARLIRDTPWLERFRERFGDERIDYAAALQRHYAGGPPPRWSERHVSAYASAHPWEDWAETWAHFLHMYDTLETARSYGLTLAPAPACGPPPTALQMAATGSPDFDEMVASWLPLTTALNSFNRGMGLADLYPFALSSEVIEKLRFVYSVITGARSSSA